MTGSDPFEQTGIDLHAQEYDVETVSDIREVVRAVANEFDEAQRWIHADSKAFDSEKPYDKWQAAAAVATSIAPYLDWDPRHVERALNQLPAVEYNLGTDENLNRLYDYVERLEEDYEEKYGHHGVPDIDDEPIWYAAQSLIHDCWEEDYRPGAVERVRKEVLQYYDSNYADDPMEVEDVGMSKEYLIHETAKILVEEYDYIYPEPDVEDWMTVLWVYDPELGIYRPRGEAHSKEVAEECLQAHATNNAVEQVFKKIRRKSRVDSWTMSGRDPNAYRVVVGNGILDLRTAELDDYTPDEYHRRRIDVEYDPDAECPEIDGFLGEIVEGRGDVQTLYRIVASSLIDELIDEKAALLVGGGSNGKSTFLQLVEEFLHKRNTSARSLSSLTSDKFAPADLHRSMVNVSADVSEQKMENLSEFKRLTGGDTYTGDIKYEKPVKFTNTASLIFASNGVPSMPDRDMAVWRRWVYVTFPYTFSGEDKVPKDELMRRLTSEDEFKGLLARCAREVAEWKTGDRDEFYANVGEPDEVRKQMMRAADPVYHFLEECAAEVERDEVASVEEMYLRKRDLHAAYSAFALEEDLPSIAYNQFCDRVKNGVGDYQVDDTRTTRLTGSGQESVWVGLTLTARGERVLNGEPDDDNGDGGGSEDLSNYAGFDENGDAKYRDDDDDGDDGLEDGDENADGGDGSGEDGGDNNLHARERETADCDAEVADDGEGDGADGEDENESGTSVGVELAADRDRERDRPDPSEVPDELGDAPPAPNEDDEGHDIADVLSPSEAGDRNE